MALEWAEGLRWLPYLCPDQGTLLADTRRIVPPFACRDRRPGARSAYPSGAAEALRRAVSRSASGLGGVGLQGLGQRADEGGDLVAHATVVG